MKIALGCDHGGFVLKEKIKTHLQEKKIDFVDLGCYSIDRAEYPIYGEKVAHAIIDKECDRGIIICGTGIGISLAANKVKGIRAAVCSDPYSALLSRQHNDSNILAIGSRVVGEGLALMIVDTWISGVFEGGRHQQRLDMISEIENKECH
ncbi:MAG: ribose 5-phosphate isomerase B [Treponemataceae bacterium]